MSREVLKIIPCTRLKSIHWDETTDRPEVIAWVEEKEKPAPQAPAFVVPDTVESKIVPGLVFHMFSGAIEFKEKNQSPRPSVFRGLLYLESRVPFGTQDEMKGLCWNDGGTDAALRKLIHFVNEFLLEIGVAQQVSEGRDANGDGIVVWK